MKDSCLFCKIEEKKIYHSINIIPKNLLEYDRKILYKGEYFVVIPDISPILPYHLLIIPILHFNSFKDIPDKYNAELKKIKEVIRKKNVQLSGNNVIFFEHGTCNDTSSACISHAHMHCLPTSKNDIEKITHSIDTLLGEPDDFIENESYLYFEKNGEKNFWADNHMEKQFLRKMITKSIGQPDRSTWQSCLVLEKERKVTMDWLSSGIENFKFK